jgi:uncharacterized protein (TIGR03089 family)
VLTFPQLLERQRRADSARPLVTFYDDATGERVELSVATYANWVAKTAGLVADELEVEPGALVLLDLPTHWLGAVWLGAVWTGGWCATAEPQLADDADLVVCGPSQVARYAPLSSERPVVALALRPLGAGFEHPLPEGVIDYGGVVLSCPDDFVPLEPPGADEAAWRDREGSLTQAQLLAAAADASSSLRPRVRLLTDVNPCSPPGLDSLVAPLLAGGGTIWVAHPEESAWQRRHDEERATDVRRAGTSQPRRS